MVTAVEVATTGIHEKLREVQRACNEDGEAVPTTFVDVINLAREGIKARHKNAALSNRQTDWEAQLLDTLAVGRTMCGQITAAKNCIKAVE